jgi:hypothetical protein
MPAIALAQPRQAGAPLNFWESATHSLNPKYWVTSHSLYRYGLASGPEGEIGRDLAQAKPASSAKPYIE